MNFNLLIPMLRKPVSDHSTVRLHHFCKVCILKGQLQSTSANCSGLASALQVKEAVEASENLLPTPPIAPAECNKVARGSSAPWRDLKGSAI